MFTTRFIIRSLACLGAGLVFLGHSLPAAEAPSESEADLIAVIRSEASPAEKAVACKKLAVRGTQDAVADLADLLRDPDLSSWARIALEAIPGEESNRALRDAAASLDGRLQVGMINSLGVRQDAEAVELLSTLLQDKDADVAAAAAVALGRIGNDKASDSLRQALAEAPMQVRSAIAEGCVLCAEQRHQSGQSDVATEMYDEIRAADVPLQRVLEATRGAILARQQEGIPLLLETYRSSDKHLFRLALGTIREFPGAELDKALVAELDSSAPARAALLIQAMADRPDTVVLAAVKDAAGEGDTQVRISAIDALQRVGDSSCLDVLLASAAESDAELADAAKETLAALPGVDDQIVAMLSDANDDNDALLLELIGQRRVDAVDEVVKALEHGNAEVRSAALYALGETVPLDRLSVLISQVVQPGHADNAADARRALEVASVRMPDRDLCTQELASAMRRASGPAQNTLLEIIGAVGGDNALKTLGAAAQSSNPEHQDIASQVLGKWNSLDAAPVLLELAHAAPADKYRIRALRGYIGLVRKFPMPETQRVEMCRSALDASSRTAERQLVLDVLKLYPSEDGMELAKQAAKLPQLGAAATAAADEIAQKLRK